MPSAKPLFTVFTGTYNRGGLLPRVYACLCAQTLQDFEWLIVDDGSTDDTRERVVTMATQAAFPIRYVYKENGGVHTAHNVAVQAAAGELFLRADSDDEFVPEALGTLARAWRAIPEGSLKKYSGVSCLCMDESGAVIGDQYPADTWDSVPSILAGLKGEKWGFHRASILRKFLFPVFPGEKFVPESLVWDRLQVTYSTRCINVPLRIYHSASGNLSKSISALRYSSGRGFLLYYTESLTRPQTVSRLVRLCSNYTRISLGLHRSWAQIIIESPRKFWTLITLPLGLALYLRDRARGLTEASS